MINQVDNYLWFKLNGLVRYVLVHTVSNVLPLYILNEYPKSGGSWVGEMLSDILNIPFPRNSLPPLKSCIMHGHMMHSWNMNNVVVVWRDGRDVLVSQYYHMLFKNDRGNSELVRKTRADLDFYDYSDIKANLSDFMEYVYEDNKFRHPSWTDFFHKWFQSDQAVHVKYEDLRLSPVAELERVVRGIGVTVPSQEEMQGVVERHSFAKMSGRLPGEENTGSFMRKGVVGDWHNHFDTNSRVKFDKYAGDELIALGYENDRQWIYDA